MSWFHWSFWKMVFCLFVCLMDFFSFITMSLLPLWHLASSVSDEKLAIILTMVPLYVMNCFTLLLQTFPFILAFSIFTVMFLGIDNFVLFCLNFVAFLQCVYGCFPSNLGGFQSLFLQIFILFLFSFSGITILCTCSYT